jgi:hypothetical protein
MSHKHLNPLNPSKPKRAAIVISNPGTSTTTGWPVGFWWAELTHPYFHFTEVGYQAEVFSPAGGACALDAMSDPEDASQRQAEDVISRGYKHDPEFVKLLENIPSAGRIDVGSFDRRSWRRPQPALRGRTKGLLAHAEMEALAALPPDKDRVRDSVLYTTLSPCPMCLGAIVVARVGQVHLGAIDPTWLGIERLPDLNDEVRHRWPQIHGPLSGPIGAWLAIAPCLNTSGALLRAMERTAPRNAALARAVNSRYQKSAHLPGIAAHALEEAWDLLTDSSR